MSDPTQGRSGAQPEDSVGGALADDATQDPAEAAAQRSGGASASGTQDAPAMDMHPATDEDKIAGIVAQTRHDVGDKPESRIADVLRQRFADIGLNVGDDRIAALAAEVAQR
jgi:hypothetical protein